MMKRYGLLFCLLLPLTLLQGADITTTKGKTYYNYACRIVQYVSFI